jgi:superfamily I DNA and RNA helicase
VYAYDELQNLSSVAMPSSTEIFGVKKDGQPVVSLEATPFDKGARRDVILERCYRNSRPILATAHALGFGIYRRPSGPNKIGLVQMFDQPDLWTDIGYEVHEGSLSPGNEVSLTRTDDTSPLFLEKHSSLSDLIQFRVFDSDQEQAEWVAEEIERNLGKEELRHDDIVVINPDPFSTRKNVGPMRKALVEKGIMSHLAGVETTPDVFFRSEDESVTFTGIYRAKGNEAGMVYVVNAHECYNTALNLARRRNMLFTAITRSKAWVRVTGVGPMMQNLIDEFEAVRAANFELRFRYPTDRERALLQIVHRDMSDEEAKTVRRRRAATGALIDDLEAGRVFLEDLDQRDLARLKRILRQDDE